jgi:hypothetical protein
VFLPIVFPKAESDHLVYFGWTLWGLTLALFLLGFWLQIVWKRWVKGALAFVAVFVFFWVAHRNIVQRLRPSFVFMVPGVVLNGDTWDFITNHRGPKSSSNVQILFIDEDRKYYLTRNKTSLTPDDINSEQALWALPEVNPMGRGNIFAQQLVWKPFNLSLSHFTAEITWRDGSVHEELQIARVQGKWQYAMQVNDRESGKRLIWCSDKEFPSNETLPPCFPDVIKESN